MTARAVAPGADALPLLDAAATCAADADAVAAGDDRRDLMARAAGHLARAVVAAAGRGYGLRVAIVVGPGDNGGDGWWAAPMLVRLGAAVVVVAPTDGGRAPSPAAAEGRDAWVASGGRVVRDPVAGVVGADVVVDALLGTGAVGPLRPEIVAATRAIVAARAAGALVVACDLPTGVAADDGAVADGAVVADVTVTMGALARGLLLHPGAAHAGRVEVGGLGPRWQAPAGAWWALTPAGAAPPPRPADDEKRRRGPVLVVAGALGTAGAAALAGRGALAAGAGLVTVATPDVVRAEVAGHDPALMVRGLPTETHGTLAADAVHALPDPTAPAAVVAGPGLGTGPAVPGLVARLVREARALVLDADALTVAGGDPGLLDGRVGTLVLTPHERELARLGVGRDGRDAWARRVVEVPRLAERTGAVVVAKGPGTLIAAPDGRAWVTPIGTPALATGGTGDVLAGMIGAAVALDAGTARPDPALAVARAVWWHAAAGVAAARAGRAGPLAVLDVVPRVLARLAAWEAPASCGPSARSVPDWHALADRLTGVGS